MPFFVQFIGQWMLDELSKGFHDYGDILLWGYIFSQIATMPQYLPYGNLIVSDHNNLIAGRYID